MENNSNNKVKFNYTGIHHCNAGVVCCEDFRFHPIFENFVENYLKLTAYDMISVAGGAKAINKAKNGEDIALKSIDVTFNLHQADKLVIINHRDCGAYGGSEKFATREAEQKFHFAELRKAKEKILTNYPEKIIILLYVDLDDTQ